MFSIEISGHWSNLSMVFFIILGLYCVWTVTKMKECESRLIHKDGNPYHYMIAFVFTLAFFAAFRVVARGGIGGMDAYAYRYMFEHANDATYQRNEWFLHNDSLFRYFVKGLRILFSEYRIYFFILYGFITLSWMMFIKEFCLKRSNYIPCILVIFIYWLSYSSIRSTLSFSVFAIALIYKHHQLLILEIYIYS